MDRTIFSLGMAIVLVAQTQSGFAQSITPDGSLNSQVISSDNQNFTITHGRAIDRHLFHSFRNFSIPTGGSATFDLIQSPNVTTIFSRITGSNLSQIDGLIQTVNHHNPVSLFLINPNGIIFGANARLSISGSFIATTANAIRFADGSTFTTHTAESPLLTISAPIGLQFGQTPGAIQVQGDGHALSTLSYFSSVDRPNMPQGLSVQPGNTLALIGGDLTFNGGVLSAEQGRLEIGSVRSGTVQFDLSNQRFQYPNDLGQVRFGAQSLLDVSGNGNGSIQVVGSDISFSEGSLLFSENSGTQAMGDLRIQATGTLNLQGMTADETIGSGLLSEVDSTGNGSNLVINANQLEIHDGAQVLSRSYNSGEGGNIFVNTIETIWLIGISPVTKTTSNIVTNNFSAGRSGNINLSATQIFADREGYIGSAPFPQATGRAGDITLRAEKIEFSGIDPVSKQTSGMGTISFGIGDAGTLTLQARQLRILDGAILDTSTYAQGKGGQLIANVTDSITISGSIPGVRLPSFLGSKAPIVNAELQALFGLPPFPTGNPGDVIVNTNRLMITDGGSLSVESDAPNGKAGSIQVNARSILLDREGSISALTTSGTGGNIQVQSDLLLLRRGGTIRTSAGGTGDGGNITLNVPVIVGLENSDIVANAIEGRGGNINITTQAMLGLQFRNEIDPANNTTSDITASSRSNLDGTVNISTPNVNPNAGLIELPVALSDPKQRIENACAVGETSRFVMTGRGGLPVNPMEQVLGDRTWADLRSLDLSRSELIQSSESMPLVEATGWTRDRTGKVTLVAGISRNSTLLNVTCAGFDRNQ